MTYSFPDWARLMQRAGEHGYRSHHAYQKYRTAQVVFATWLYWFRRNGD